jgi:hypothetical protein
MNQVTVGACHIASFRWAGAKFWAQFRKLANCPVWKTGISVLHFGPKSRRMGLFYP